ncbi:4a-hydroxytetrahydrobiopterin dehydratase [Argonema galeatum]|uniref:4a-hydroxytetrahydrobiopterin dehydratase n=1 Tax=Argonema galeatum TaxID=2942762 RepID=UPI002011533A|nr:4a-hydroxytetrahydrobiopterin dehydratase [Argonema galeatum]MCL1464022.1 4a-hydroxytetrahydrobiopterin dehydratase [Argonema galeatum A003/A1]
MAQLAQQECTACTADSPRVLAAEIVKLSPQIPDWNIVEEEGESRLKRIYKFPDFLKALDFTNKVGDIAEKAGHHPALLTEWGKVTVSWWTHSIGGLHKNDFIMAAKTDEIASQVAEKK